MFSNFVIFLHPAPFCADVIYRSLLTKRQPSSILIMPRLRLVVVARKKKAPPRNRRGNKLKALTALDNSHLSKPSLGEIFPLCINSKLPILCYEILEINVDLPPSLSLFGLRQIFCSLANYMSPSFLHKSGLAHHCAKIVLCQPFSARREGRTPEGG